MEAPFDQFEQFGDGNGPMERFFKQFRDGQGDGKGDGNRQPRWQSPFSTSLGSGFIISEDGYVVTNDHVVEEGQSVTVVLDDGTEYDGQGHRRRREDRPRAPQDRQSRPQVHLRQVRRRRGARRRLGGGGRQSRSASAAR